MATNQVIVIQVKDEDGNEDRYFSEINNMPDMLIEVGGDSNGTNTTFHVHQSVLHESSSIFGEICETEKDEDMTNIPIFGVNPEIFHHLIFDIYGGMVSNNILRVHAKDIIEAADRYGVEKLKLKAEEMYLEQNAITFDNIMDTLLYSDAKNCTIIKEVVMDNLVRLSDTAFVQELSFKGVPGHLMKDLLTAVVRGVGGLAVKVKDIDERQKESDEKWKARQLEIKERIEAERAERLSWQRETDERLNQMKAENDEQLAQMKAENIANKKEIDERLDKTEDDIAHLKKFTQAKYRKAILLSFIVGLLSSVTIEYVFACILGYT